MLSKKPSFSLKAIRMNLGLTLEEASEMIGVSKYTLSNYERGDTYPDVPVLKRIEEVYKIKMLNDTVNFLLDDTAESGKDEEKKEVQ